MCYRCAEPIAPTESSIRAIRIASTLNQEIRVNQQVQCRRFAIETRIAAGWRVVVANNGERRLTSPEETFLAEKGAFGKIAFDYAELLSENLSPIHGIKTTQLVAEGGK